MAAALLKQHAKIEKGIEKLADDFEAGDAKARLALPRVLDQAFGKVGADDPPADEGEAQEWAALTREQRAVMVEQLKAQLDHGVTLSLPETENVDGRATEGTSLNGVFVP